MKDRSIRRDHDVRKEEQSRFWNVTHILFLFSVSDNGTSTYDSESSKTHLLETHLDTGEGESQGYGIMRIWNARQ